MATVNLNNGQLEVGYGGSAKLGPNVAGFYNARAGGRGETRGFVPGEDLSTSGNFGIINKSAADPIGDAAVGFVVDNVGKALQTIALAADAATIPSGEGVWASFVIAGGGEAIKKVIQKNTDWYFGFAWRGADVEVYPNGETTLNLTGASFRLRQGEGPGGSGRPSSDFLWDNRL